MVNGIYNENQEHPCYITGLHYVLGLTLNETIGIFVYHNTLLLFQEFTMEFGSEYVYVNPEDEFESDSEPEDELPPGSPASWTTPNEYIDDGEVR